MKSSLVHHTGQSRQQRGQPGVPNRQGRFWWSKAGKGIAVFGSMIPPALILLWRRSDVPGTRTNHLICLILLNAMADPADGSS